jgi:hypothetical protein
MKHKKAKPKVSEKKAVFFLLGGGGGCQGEEVGNIELWPYSAFKIWVDRDQEHLKYYFVFSPIKHNSSFIIY